MALTVSVGSALVPAVALGADGESGWRSLSGARASSFQIPSDTRLVRTWRDPRSGFVFERYQQVARPLAEVDGAQLTVVRDGSRQMLVLGAHYPGISAVNSVELSPTEAVSRAEPDAVNSARAEQPPIAELEQSPQLRLDPTTRRLFYRVESTAPGIRTFHDVDAQSGAVINAWDAIDRVNGMGTGVKSDRKSLLGNSSGSTTDDLTRQVSGVWRMQSVDNRLKVYDAKNGGLYDTSMPVMSDKSKPAWSNDNDWKAPYQGAAVDAQYYAALSDSILRDTFGFDLLDPSCGYGTIRSVVHFDPFGFGYDNAFWDGQFLVYGDGDRFTTWSYTAGQDVVTHELTHAVTECATGLVYEDEPGALNEAISDIVGTVAEWQIDEPLTTNCRRATGQAECPDWWIAEDVVFDSALGYAFRNMADPESLNQPSHYSDRYTGGEDNGGVHINSGIANHAFYLMVNGGRNARCAGPNDAQADCGVLVPAIGMTDAAQIAFAAWSSLTSEADFCEARNATISLADTLFPASAAHRASAELSWKAVGLDGQDCDTGPGFSIRVNQDALGLGPGDGGQFVISVNGTPNGTVTYDTSDPAPLQVSANANGTVDVSAPADVASGVYPLVLSASDSSATRYAAVVVVVDGTPPSASVDAVRISSPGTVTNGGTVPLVIGWSSSDTESGIATAGLEHSPTGSSWTQISNPTAIGGSTTYSSQAGPHSFRVEA
ncbi:MAG TPA: M4 family metallopeptidase, partial [Candidatus Limnocylindrales bacterium]|nr:M4 family metallopeptidase [Candidatus Limnocylindrales bacterium]